MRDGRIASQAWCECFANLRERVILADGVWTMDDEGNFALNEPYASLLTEIKLEATNAWTQTLLTALSERSMYTAQELKDELLRRSGEKDLTGTEIVNEFIIEALSGDL